MRRLLLLLLMLLSLEIAHAGTDPRLQQALSNWQQGQTLTVAVIGGSITTGYAASPPRQQGWAGQLQRWQGEIIAAITSHSEQVIAAELATHETQVRQAYASQLQSIIGE